MRTHNIQMLCCLLDRIKMKLIKSIFYVLIISSLSACSMKSVKLAHANDPDLIKVCRHAFIDWRAASHMVDFYNFKCAQRAIEQGYLLGDSNLSSKDFSIPEAPSGKTWNEALALKELSADRITREKYGYILAVLEMKYRAKISKAKSELESGKITKEEFDNIKEEASEAFYGVPTT